MAWTAPSTWVSGAILTAAQLNQQLRDNMLEFSDFFAAWTTFTPTLSATGGGLNLGTTGTQAAAYCKVGRTVFWRAQWATGGTGIATGTGSYQFTLPAGIGTAAASGTVIASGVVFGGSGNYGNATAFMSSTSVVQFYGDATPALIGSGSYGAAASWIMRVAGVFEAAS